jgi:DNA adenine methylase
MTAPTRPVLRYHGGKWRSAPKILAFFPPHRVYVEPFGGGASVLIRKPRSYAEVYNDLAGEVVNVFRVLRDPATAVRLRELLHLTPFGRDEFLAAYQYTDDSIEQARRAIARAFMGFGSASFNAKHGTGFRSNSKRSGTTPALDWMNYPDQVPAFVERLRGVVIENRDALLLMPVHDSPATLFYVDPPYPGCVRAEGAITGVRQRYVHELTDDDHRALARSLHALEGMVVLSGRGCALYDVELYPDWERHEFKHLDDGARSRTEVLWLNPACSAGLRASRDQMSLEAMHG